MSERTEILTLMSEIRASREVIDRIVRFYDARFASQTREENTDNAIVLAEILSNYYTALETIFLRISRFFENSLSPESWHKDLLSKMLIDIPETRPRVISDAGFRDLQELLRFRHFRRYYLEFDYDWRKLRLAEECFVSARTRVASELDSFQGFLERLSQQTGEV